VNTTNRTQQTGGTEGEGGGEEAGGTGTRRSSVRILSSHPSWPLQPRAESAGTGSAHAQYQPAPSPLVLVAARTRSHFRRLAFGHASFAAHESPGISASHADLSIHDSALTGSCKTGAEPGVTSTVVHAWATGHTITSAHSTNAAVQATRMARHPRIFGSVRGKLQQSFKTSPGNVARQATSPGWRGAQGQAC
jgi:hypothetical protein